MYDKYKLWLSTKDDHGHSKDDPLTENKKLERLFAVFVSPALVEVGKLSKKKGTQTHTQIQTHEKQKFTLKPKTQNL